MPETTNLSIRIDRSLKDEADQLFYALGLNLTTAITMFVRQAVRQKKIPFEVALYPDIDRDISLQEAIAASERIWQYSVKNGLDQMSPEEINTEIAAARAERKAHGTSNVASI